MISWRSGSQRKARKSWAENLADVLRDLQGPSSVSCSLKVRRHFAKCLWHDRQRQLNLKTSKRCLPLLLKLKTIKINTRLGQQNSVRYYIKRINVCWEILGDSAGDNSTEWRKESKDAGVLEAKDEGQLDKTTSGKEPNAQNGTMSVPSWTWIFCYRRRFSCFPHFHSSDLIISVFLPLKQHVSGMQSVQHCITKLALSTKV